TQLEIVDVLVNLALGAVDVARRRAVLLAVPLRRIDRLDEQPEPAVLDEVAEHAAPADAVDDNVDDLAAQREAAVAAPLRLLRILGLGAPDVADEVRRRIRSE